MKNNKTTIDLFAGMGGIRLAFEKAGFTTIFANDYEAKCKENYDLNFSEPKLTIKDLKKVVPKSLPKFDFLLGGFPCQPFSIAGDRKGIKDERGTLFFNVLDIITAHQPAGFFLENVKNLAGESFKETFNIILSKLNDAGYNVKYQVLNSMEHGNVPQNRERVYIVGFKKELNLINKFDFPKKIKLTKSIDDILESEIDKKYYYTDSLKVYDKLKDYPFEQGKVYQWRRKYVRENKSGVCPTLTANMGTGGHNVPIIFDGKGIRKLTPRECASIQGFPKNYKLANIADSHLYKQIGNSVSVPVVYRIAKNIAKALG